MSGVTKVSGTWEWQYAHILWQKHGIRMEEFAEMPHNVKMAYVASEELEKEYPIVSTDRLAKAYIKSN